MGWTSLTWEAELRRRAKKLDTILEHIPKMKHPPVSDLARVIMCGDWVLIASHRAGIPLSYFGEHLFFREDGKWWAVSPDIGTFFDDFIKTTGLAKGDADRFKRHVKDYLKTTGNTCWLRPEDWERKVIAGRLSHYGNLNQI